MATGDRVMTSWQFQHEMIEAAQERGWEVTRIDARSGVTLEEPAIAADCWSALAVGLAYADQLAGVA